MAVTGSVSRWFNRKGYGFVNVMNSDSEHCGQDIFVHLSGINVKNDGYKCLYPGEYVSFDLDKNNDGKLVGVNVSGVMGGSLLVEHPDFMFKYSPKNRQQGNGEQSSGKQVVSDPDTGENV
jgi:cold shock CspA family protein